MSKNEYKTLMSIISGSKTGEKGAKPGTQDPRPPASRTPGTGHQVPPPGRPLSKTPSGAPEVDEPAGHRTRDPRPQDTGPTTNDLPPGIIPPPGVSPPIPRPETQDPRPQEQDPRPETVSDQQDPTPLIAPRQPETQGPETQDRDAVPRMPEPPKNLFETVREKAGSLLSSAKQRWDSVKKRVIRTAIIIGSIAAIATGSLYGYGWYKDHKKEQAREKARIEAKRKLEAEEAKLKKDRKEERRKIIARMRDCRDGKRLEKLCLEENIIALRKKGAETSEKAGDFQTAGIKFARNGNQGKASLMIKQCEKPEPKTRKRKPRTRDLLKRELQWSMERSAVPSDTRPKEQDSEAGNGKPETNLCADRIRAELKMVADAMKKGEEEYSKRLEELEKEQDKEREQEKKRIIARMKNCKDETLLTNLGLSQTAFELRKKNAEGLMRAQEFEAAGVEYTRIGMHDMANSMAGRCDERGRERIRKELKMVADAIAAYTSQAE